MNRKRFFLVGTVMVLLVCASLYRFLPQPTLSYRSPVCHSPTLPTATPKEPYEDSEAYEVYSAIIPTVPPNPKWQTWFIFHETTPHVPDVPTAPAPSQELITDAVNSYLKANARSWFLRDRFKLSKPYRLLTREQMNEMFPPTSMEPFYERYIKLSAVGFNANKTRAVVYMEHWCVDSCCCGDGWVFELKKTFYGEWRILKKSDCWIS
jgi:hypothetical protein